jgi:Tol biopolymer transport system component
MKKLALVLLVVCVVPMPHGVIAQQSANLRFANEWCYPRVYEGGWTGFDICEVQIFDTGGETYISGVSPAWSPDGLRIAYLESDLYVYDRTTHASVMVAQGLFVSGTVRWSRDGAYIALVRSFEGAAGWTPELVVIEPDGSSLTRLTHGVGFQGSYSWSPNGAHIALVGSFEGAAGWTPELVVIEPDGSNLRRPTQGVGFQGSYAWSPSGNAIAFGRDSGGVQELYVMGADGSNATRLTYGAGFRGAISWSPDGGKIAFDCGTTICAIRPDGTNLVQLVPAGSDASTAIFSPVGGNMAFWSGGLKVMRADGSIVAVAPGLYATKPTWSPDGRTLAFVVPETSWFGGACNGDGSPCGRSPDYTYVVEADGSGLRILAYGTNPAWFVPLPGQPSAAFTTTCAERTCQFNAAGSSDPDGAIVNYEWRFGDGSTGSGQAPSHTYSYAGGSTYAAILIVTDDDGQRDATHGRTVTLPDSWPVASFTFACTGLTCAFDASSSFDDGSISSYLWYFQDGAYGNGRTPSYQYPTGGTYWVTLSVTDNFNQTSSVTRTVTAVAPPLPAMHLGDLDAASTTTQKSWNANVTIEIHTENHGGVAGVEVSGVWADGSPATCTTDGSGRCAVSRAGIPRKTSSIGFTVTSATHSSFVFSPGASHDADGDSNGTAIVIRRQ